MTRKNGILSIVFVLSMAVSFSQFTNVFKINYYLPYAIGIFWIFIAGLKYLITRGKVLYSKIIKFYLRIFITPWIVFTLHNIFLYSINDANRIYLKTSISGILVMIITILSACSSIYLFKEKAYKYVMRAIIISFTMVIIKNIYLYGVSIIWQVFYKTIFTKEAFINPFEVSDITFAVAIVILSFNAFKINKKLEEKIYILSCYFIIIIGFKRIQILALIIILCLLLYFKSINYTLKSKLVRLIGVSSIIISLIYIFIIDSGIMNNIIEYYKINTMGRLTMYNFISDYYDFNITFIGMGYGFTLKKLSEYGFEYVLHSDILRIYIEFGFLVFIWWIWFSIIQAYKKIEKKISAKDAIIYFLSTLYLFILHFTDNTTNYFVTQYIYVVVPMSIAIINYKDLDAKKI